MLFGLFYLLAVADPNTCAPRAAHPYMPIFHVIGNVTSDPSTGQIVGVEAINGTLLGFPLLITPLFLIFLSPFSQPCKTRTEQPPRTHRFIATLKLFAHWHTCFTQICRRVLRLRVQGSLPRVPPMLPEPLGSRGIKRLDPLDQAPTTSGAQHESNNGAASRLVSCVLYIHPAQHFYRGSC
jgi:hypothetical protein